MFLPVASTPDGYEGLQVRNLQKKVAVDRWQRQRLFENLSHLVGSRGNIDEGFLHQTDHL
jgi:hypothetical protein